MTISKSQVLGSKNMFLSDKSGILQFFGKGGQGVVTGAKLFFECIKEQYGNPELVGEFIYAPGAERRGTDIGAPGIIAEHRDRDLLKIQEFGEFDIFAAFSEDIVGNIEILEKIKPGGKLIVNSKKSAWELSGENSQLKDYDLFCVDATGIYSEVFEKLKGCKPSIEEIKPNGPMVAAVCASTGLVEISTLEAVIKNYWGEGATLLSARAAYEKVTYEPASSVQKQIAERKKSGKVFMEVPISKPDWASAGAHTGAWRGAMELYIDYKRCVRCSSCVDYCPEGAIDKIMLPDAGADENWDRRGIYIDRDYCKGCGICVSVCGTGAIKYKEAAA